MFRRMAVASGEQETVSGLAELQAPGGQNQPALGKIGNTRLGQRRTSRAPRNLAIKPAQAIVRSGWTCDSSPTF